MSLMIAMPCYGGNVSDKTVISLFNLGKLLNRNNIDNGLLVMANQSLITQARTKIANFFLNNTEYEYLLFLDADVGFKPDDVLKLLSHKKDIVGGTYPMKSIPLRWPFTLSQPEQRDGDLIKIENNGIGFTLIHRSVFQKIIEKYGKEIKFFPVNNDVNQSLTEKEYNNSYHFFGEIKIDDYYFSEDKSFFYLTKQCGIENWLDVSINLSHVGSHVFEEKE